MPSPAATAFGRAKNAKNQEASLSAKSCLSPSSPPRTNGPKGSNTGSAHSHGALVCFSCSDKLINQLRTGAPLGPDASDFMRARREMFEVAENEKGLDSELQSLQTSMVLLQTVVVVVIIFDFCLLRLSSLVSKCAFQCALGAQVWAIVANTMPTAFWALYFIVRSREALEAITAELASVATSSSAALSPGQLDKLLGLDSAILEALRLTSGSIIMREVVSNSGHELALPGLDQSVFLRSGDWAALFPPLLHYDSRLFPEASEFKHDRFVGEKGRALARHVKPFGGGVSMCPGRFFAVREVKSFVALALARYEWRIPNAGHDAKIPPFDSSRSGLGIYPPQDDISIRVRPRT